VSCPSTEAPTRRRRSLAAGAGAFVVLAVLWGSATAASAHVTVHPTSVAAGTDDFELHFFVPNERDDANTVRVQLFLPASPPLPEVDVLPVSGWAAHVSTETLRHPIQTDDGPVDQAVTAVDLHATAGGTAPGQFEDFTLLVGAGPTRPGTVVFKALQTYSNGDIVRWIEIPTAQVPQPQFPAPVLTVTPAPASSPALPSASHGASSGNDSTAETLAVVAMIGAGIAVLLGMIAVMRRRSPPPD
jgi:uncharacterized protein YcnI